MHYISVILKGVEIALAKNHANISGPYTVELGRDRITLYREFGDQHLIVEKRLSISGKGIIIEHWNKHPLRSDIILTHTTSSRTSVIGGDGQRNVDDVTASVISSILSIERLVDTMTKSETK